MHTSLVRAIACVAACVLLSLVSVPVALAQSYPAKAIRLIVPYAAGGGADNIARTISSGLAEDLGQPLVIENKPGAGATLGADAVAKAPPDGYTLLLLDVSHAMSASFYPKLPYDAVGDFAFISQVVTGANVLVVNPGVPARSLAELVAYAKANPGKLTFGSGGNGTSPHLGVELLKALSGTDLVHVPYKGVAPAMVDLLAGRIDIMVGGLSAALPYIRAGTLRALAVTSSQRISSLPDLPTIAESGVVGYELSTWFGVAAPKGTPPGAIARINRSLAKVLSQPDVKAHLRDAGLEVATGTPEQFTELVRDELAKWKKVVPKQGL